MKTTMNVGYGWPILVALTLAVTLGANGAKANAQQVMFLVRYAETDPAGKTLTEVGRIASTDRLTSPTALSQTTSAAGAAVASTPPA